MENIILDTDLGGDVDDLGALAVLHTLRAAGLCELLGVMSVTPQSGAVEAIVATNRFFDAGAIPVGRPPWAMRSEGSYADAVAQAAHVSLDMRDVPLSTALYRRLLADADDASVTIATIGPLFLLDQLLTSPADAVTKLTGSQLVEAKLKRVVVMGGFHHSATTKPETNFAAWGVPGVTARVLETLQCPIEFCTFELGALEHGYGTGERLAELPLSHPVRVGYDHFFAHPPWWVKGGATPIRPWSIWDQITVLHAALPDNPWLDTLWDERCIVDPAGRTTWTRPASGLASHGRLVDRQSPRALANDVIEPLMMGRLPAGILK
ncbi:MAG TPA: hypothetical protein VGN72_22240 [Tepidisphaeraceae bacterium]|jgi:hypothetical protein|nr:hypothetical protein [Tepidisphaeraceae bacterium]